MTDTTTQWRGLHNPERHFSAFGTGTPLCEECGDVPSYWQTAVRNLRGLDEQKNQSELW